mmetsp:Transcript_41460/g.47856  ORF Transcript_41460/g.47856 Transcript_41460/m.47856 type:complete len:903 (+) Transcript_41460:273-2981(+)
MMMDTTSTAPWRGAPPVPVAGDPPTKQTTAFAELKMTEFGNSGGGLKMSDFGDTAGIGSLSSSATSSRVQATDAILSELDDFDIDGIVSELGFFGTSTSTKYPPMPLNENSNDGTDSTAVHANYNDLTTSNLSLNLNLNLGCYSNTFTDVEEMKTVSNVDSSSDGLSSSDTSSSSSRSNSPIGLPSAASASSTSRSNSTSPLTLQDQEDLQGQQEEQYCFPSLNLSNSLPSITEHEDQSGVPIPVPLPAAPTLTTTATAPSMMMTPAIALLSQQQQPLSQPQLQLPRSLPQAQQVITPQVQQQRQQPQPQQRVLGYVPVMVGANQVSQPAAVAAALYQQQQKQQQQQQQRYQVNQVRVVNQLVTPPPLPTTTNCVRGGLMNPQPLAHPFNGVVNSVLEHQRATIERNQQIIDAQQTNLLSRQQQQVQVVGQQVQGVQVQLSAGQQQQVARITPRTATTYSSIVEQKRNAAALTAGAAAALNTTNYNNNNNQSLSSNTEGVVNEYFQNVNTLKTNDTNNMRSRSGSGGFPKNINRNQASSSDTKIQSKKKTIVNKKKKETKIKMKKSMSAPSVVTSNRSININTNNGETKNSYMKWKYTAEGATKLKKLESKKRTSIKKQPKMSTIISSCNKRGRQSQSQSQLQGLKSIRSSSFLSSSAGILSSSANNGMKNEVMINSSNIPRGEMAPELLSVRRERNRKHAKKSRLRKKDLTTTLEQSLDVLKDENELLRHCLQEHFDRKKSMQGVASTDLVPDTPTSVTCSLPTTNDVDQLLEQRRVRSHDRFIHCIVGSRRGNSHTKTKTKTIRSRTGKGVIMNEKTLKILRALSKTVTVPNSTVSTTSEVLATAVSTAVSPVPIPITISSSASALLPSSLPNEHYASSLPSNEYQEYDREQLVPKRQRI